MDYMKIADEEAKINLVEKEGGPFGAVIVKDGQIISRAHNQVLKNNDPTAHAEVMAIRKACEKLNTYDLSNCEIYSSCMPCPMCMSAIIWANIKKVYYGNTAKDAEMTGFRDDYIYEYLKGNRDDVIELIPMGRDETIETFNEFNLQTDKKIY